MRFYSQFGQDKLVASLCPSWRGVYVDVGAGDGITHSNTYHFEQLGWRGLCVEAHPVEYRALKKNRGGCAENVAVSTLGGQRPFVVSPVKGWSGLVDTYKHLTPEEQAWADKEGESEVIVVECVPLQTLLDRYDLHRIDYLSVDVEGGELAVLESICWERTAVKVITVEVNDNAEGIQRLLLGKGFALWGELGVDQVWVSQRWVEVRPC